MKVTNTVFGLVEMRKVISGLFVTVALICTPVSDAAPPTRSVGQALGVLPGDNQSIGFGVNDGGSVVGRSSGLGGERAFYWDRPTGTLYQLTTSGANGVARAIAGSAGATAYAVGSERVAGGSNHAVIWIAPPTSSPIVLDGDRSEAFGVNDNGIAVGLLLGIPAIWSPTVNNSYARTDVALLPNHVGAIANDIDNDGIVVGTGFEDTTFRARAFLRLLNGTVLELAPAQGDVESTAEAVSDVFADVGNGFVHVAGSTVSASGVPRGVKWIVNVDTGAVVDQTVLSLQQAFGVNGAGDVAGTSAKSPRGQQTATLWRGGSYIKLTPPKGGSGGSSHGLARTALSPTYVVGETRIKTLPQAVVWEVN